MGTDGHYTTGEITAQLRNVIVSRFADFLGESSIPALDLASNYDELGAFMTSRVKPEFNACGLDLTKFLVENISLLEEVESALDKRTSMGAVGNLGAFSQFQAATAMEAAAENPRTAGSAAAMGMGFLMGSQMGQAATPPPIPQAVQFFVADDGQPQTTKWYASQAIKMTVVRRYPDSWTGFADRYLIHRYEDNQTDAAPYGCQHRRASPVSAS